MHSGIKLELDNSKFNFSAGVDLFEDLTIGKSSDKYEYILPYYNFSSNILAYNNGTIDFIDDFSKFPLFSFGLSVVLPREPKNDLR